MAPPQPRTPVRVEAWRAFRGSCGVGAAVIPLGLAFGSAYTLRNVAWLNLAIAGPILTAITVTVGLQLWRSSLVLSMAGGTIVHVNNHRRDLLMFENRASLSSPTDEAVGFVGLGVMGQPMALNLAKAGTRLIVWNRTAERTQPLLAAGAVAASSVAEVFAGARVVILMLVNETVADAVLGGGAPRFAELVCDHVVVSMGSTAPDYSRALAADIQTAGGRYVEAPVSGSKKPAEAGELVALLGGHPDTIAEVRPLLAPMCRQTLICGPVGSGLLMKLAVNLYLDTMLAGLAEAVHFADRQRLDLHTFQAAIDSGPMACDITRIKIPKLLARDFEVQAATSDAYANTLLIAAEARAAGIATPLLELASQLYGEAVSLGHSRLDMISVLQAIEARTDNAHPHPHEDLHATDQ